MTKADKDRQLPDNTPAKRKGSASAKATQKLLFIDANKWLDFYRADNETGLKLLRDIEAVSDRLIVTYLLEVEFKKNRQTVLINSWKNLTPPKLAFPNIIADENTAQELNQYMEAAERHVKKLKELMMQVMASPTEHDVVYHAVERMFHRNSDLVLSRDNDLRKEIRDKAERRFWQGYPPRKEGDISMGDALHWEWMVHCAAKRKSDLVIITRDKDFGVRLGDKSYLNDHLQQEFKERVGKDVVLFNRFTPGLKYLGVPVSEKDAAAERQWFNNEELLRRRLRPALERVKARYLSDLEGANGSRDDEPVGKREG